MAEVVVENVDEIAQDFFVLVYISKDGIPGRDTSGSMRKAPQSAFEVCLKNQRNLYKNRVIYLLLFASDRKVSNSLLWFREKISF